MNEVKSSALYLRDTRVCRDTFCRSRQEAPCCVACRTCQCTGFCRCNTSCVQQQHYQQQRQQLWVQWQTTANCSHELSCNVKPPCDRRLTVKATRDVHALGYWINQLNFCIGIFKFNILFFYYFYNEWHKTHWSFVIFNGISSSVTW